MTVGITDIGIFGERCSGTTYLENLILKNLRGVQISWKFGFKHWFHREGVEHADGFLFVIIYRNPFDWVRSLHGRPWHAAPELRSLPFSEFIRRTWWCIWDEQSKTPKGDPRYGTEILFERDPQTRERFANVLSLRTAKIRGWECLRHKATNTVYVRYEDLRASPETFIATVATRFGIPRTERFENILTAQARPGDSGRFVPKSYDPISSEDLRYIVDELDGELEKSIGYDIEQLATTLAP